MIERVLLLDLFERARRLRDEGKAQFDVDDVCRWSYFFVDSSREKLIEVGKFLEKIGYEVIGFLDDGEEESEETDGPAEDDDTEDDEGKSIFLRADRVESHTVDSLEARNKVLDDIAERFGVICDGMDVGAVDGP